CRGIRTVDGYARDCAAELHFAEIQLVDAGATPFVDERGRDSLRARGHAQPKPATLVELHRSAVERDVDAGAVAIHELPRGVLPACGRHEGVHGELVLRVERKRVLHRDTAARAERQSLDVTALRGAAEGRVAYLAVAHRKIADGAAADLHRGLRVAFEQRG